MTTPAAKAAARSPWPVPTARQVVAVTRALAGLHGRPTRSKPASARPDVRQSCGMVPTVLESVVRTILSQNTTNKNSNAAMASLLSAYGRDWQAMRRAGPSAIGKAIAIGGLGQVKGRRIHALLCDLHSKGTDISLEHVRLLSDEDAKATLLAYEGIGPKTASCVLLFCLGRDSFAVDTHVLRIARRLGWVRPQASREQAYMQLDAVVPAAQKYALHVLLVQHGKCCVECAANGRPQQQPIGPCPLTPLLPRVQAAFTGTACLASTTLSSSAPTKAARATPKRVAASRAGKSSSSG